MPPTPPADSTALLDNARVTDRAIPPCPGARDEAFALRLPPPPAILKQPLRLGGIPIPTRFFLAPMAGFTSLAFRLSVRERGGLGLVTTDLVNCRSLLENRQRALELTETDPADRPVAMQLYGSKIEEMTAAAARLVERGATLVDINMGCPVRKVVKTGGGSALMCEVDNAARLVEEMVKAVEVPVTVKTRLGWDEHTLSAPDLARAFEQAGAAALVVHGRTRAQGFKGPVNREGIRAVVEAVKTMPVVGNGDIRTIHDAETMFRETGCAAVSLGRGALANPFIFRHLDHWARTGEAGPEPEFAERVDLVRRHFRRLVALRGERFGCLQFRKLVKWYSMSLRPPKSLYHQLINLSSVAQFETTMDAIEAAGPTRPMPSAHEFAIPVPSGPIDKW